MNRNFRRFAAAVVAFTLALVALPAFAAEQTSGVVNVNSASAAELERLPGVGPALASRIVDHRSKNGNFQKAEDLMLVKGIGEKSFDRIKPYVALSGETTLKAAIGVPRAPKAAAKAQG